MHIHFEPFAGVSGDMLLASLIDAGGDIEVLNSQLHSALPFEFSIKPERVLRKGISGTYLHINISEEAPPLRHLANLIQITEQAKLSESVKKRAIKVFRKIAEAEANVHGVDIEKVHFHEIGAGDTLIDVLGAFILSESMGAHSVSTSKVTTGSGLVETAHGMLPIPAPATALLLEGLPLAGALIEGECTTPTGAALLNELAETHSRPDNVKISKLGYGFGTRPGKVGPNALRVSICEVASDENLELVSVLETTIDDATGEQIGYLREVLEKNGALEVSTMAVGMKSSRPGVRLVVIAHPSEDTKLSELILRESSTFGVRIRTERRQALEREFVTASTPWGEVNVKIGRLNNEVLQTSPEYRDCKKIAEEKNIPINKVYEAALNGLATDF